MTYRGKVQGGVIVLEHPASLPEGTAVEVRRVEVREAEVDELQDLRQTLLRFAGKATGLPADLARNHDLYLHGRSKRLA